MQINNDLIVRQLCNMLKYQKMLNDVFDPKWRENRHQYLRAAVVEGAEMIDHHGYKWWKKQVKDVPQMHLELVDIMHFYLSEVARLEGEESEAALVSQWLADDAVLIFDGKTYDLRSIDLLDQIELIIGLSVSRRMSWSLFRAIMDGAGMSFADLHFQYAAKNVLNLFRQHHGDKTGEYIKKWNGIEDNVYLVELMNNTQGDIDMDKLYQDLDVLYRKHALGVS